MLRDVSTRWNSTFDMLDFALKYRPAINTMTATWDFNLCKYELVPEEWRIAGELRDVLQVYMVSCPFPFTCTSSFDRFSRIPRYFSRMELQT
jgi:hypothetical protein